MKCFVAVLLLALFAVAMAGPAQDTKPKVQVDNVEVTKEAPVDEATRDKRGAIVVPGYAPLAYSAYTPYAYSSYLPYAYPHFRYSYPYYNSLSIYG